MLRGLAFCSLFFFFFWGADFIGCILGEPPSPVVPSLSILILPLFDAYTMLPEGFFLRVRDQFFLLYFSLFP